MRLKRTQGGMTFLETLAWIASVSIVASVIITAGKEVRYRANMTICMNNLQQISLALAGYYNDFADYPRGLPYNTLRTQLQEYAKSNKAFICPEDKLEKNDSYSQFYTYRGEDMSSLKYVIGCPRHKKDTVSMSIFSLQTAQKCEVAQVTVDRKNIAPGAVATGTMTLEDGSTVTSSNAKMLLVQSVRMENGVLYTVVRIPDGETGTVSVQATHGTKLEVVTPSLVAGVRGTAFTINVGYKDNKPFSNVAVTDGLVAVMPLTGELLENGTVNGGAGKRTIPLEPGMTVEIQGNPPPINETVLSDRLSELQDKIERGIAAGLNMDAEKDLYSWLSGAESSTPADETPAVETPAEEDPEPSPEEPVFEPNFSDATNTPAFEASPDELGGKKDTIPTDPAVLEAYNEEFEASYDPQFESSYETEFESQFETIYASQDIENQFETKITAQGGRLWNTSQAMKSHFKAKTRMHIKNFLRPYLKEILREHLKQHITKLQHNLQVNLQYNIPQNLNQDFATNVQKYIDDYIDDYVAHHRD